MSKVLNAIGGFFKRIGRWIKETAWIQPLLIVGAIFGLIMSIKPITQGINNLLNFETTSNFYKNNIVNYDQLAKKVDSNGENDVLIVIFIKEKNEQCAQCESQQSKFEDFFADNHDKAEDGRKYSIAVLDIATDEFDEEKVESNESFVDIHDDVIAKWDLHTVWKGMPIAYNPDDGTEIDVEGDDPLPTPTIARFDGKNCVGVAMGFGDYKSFLKFCYADDVDNSGDTFEHVPGE